MTDIALSRGIRDNLFSLQQTSEGIGVAQNRLATGKRVNSAIDNPTNFFTSAKLNSRANDLNGLLDGIGNALKTVAAADNGIKAITRLVENAQSTARSALQSSAGNLSDEGTALTGNPAVTSGQTLLVNVGGTNQTFTAGASETVSSFVKKINDANVGVKAELTSDNKFKLTALGGESLDIGAGTANTTLGLATDPAAVARTATNTSATRQNLATQFNDLRSQISQLAKDASFNGVNLLAGDNLKVLFNEKTEVADQSTLTIKGASFDAQSLGINAVAATGTNGFQTDSEINTSLKGLEGALNSLRAQSATFGSQLAVIQTRQDFTKQTVNTLKSGADNLVLADQNEEAANLLTLQTRQQLSSQALSLASQQQQSVLRLLG
jgi:flagellin-like hook-associated protein FlgL